MEKTNLKSWCQYKKSKRKIMEHTFVPEAYAIGV